MAFSIYRYFKKDMADSKLTLFHYSIQAHLEKLCFPRCLAFAKSSTRNKRAFTSKLATLLLLLYGLDSMLQHILNKNPISACGILHENVGYCSNNFAVLDDGRT